MYGWLAGLSLLSVAFASLTASGSPRKVASMGMPRFPQSEGRAARNHASNSRLTTTISTCKSEAEFPAKDRILTARSFGQSSSASRNTMTPKGLCVLAMLSAFSRPLSLTSEPLGNLIGLDTSKSRTPACKHRRRNMGPTASTSPCPSTTGTILADVIAISVRAGQGHLLPQAAEPAGARQE